VCSSDLPQFKADFLDPYPDLVEINPIAPSALYLHDGRLVFSIHEEQRICHEIGHCLTLDPLRWYRLSDAPLGFHRLNANSIDFRFGRPTTNIGLQRLCENEVKATAIEMLLCARYGYRVPDLNAFFDTCRDHIRMNYPSLASYCPSHNQLYDMYRRFMIQCTPMEVPSYDNNRYATTAENSTKNAVDFIDQWRDLMRRLAEMKKCPWVHWKYTPERGYVRVPHG
jgi:hypothetical protein